MKHIFTQAKVLVPFKNNRRDLHKKSLVFYPLQCHNGPIYDVKEKPKSLQTTLNADSPNIETKVYGVNTR